MKLNNCKKNNNNKFYLVLNFTKTINWNITNLLYYIDCTITYLQNNKNSIYTSVFLKLLQNLYTPIKPIKYISPIETINFSFINS